MDSDKLNNELTKALDSLATKDREPFRKQSQLYKCERCSTEGTNAYHKIGNGCIKDYQKDW